MSLPMYYHNEVRLALGECWMICLTCGSKLYSFDGDEDKSRPCPYMVNGKCVPKELYK